jgi:hypothetical protein
MIKKILLFIITLPYLFGVLILEIFLFIMFPFILFGFLYFKLFKYLKNEKIYWKEDSEKLFSFILCGLLLYLYHVWDKRYLRIGKLYLEGV